MRWGKAALRSGREHSALRVGCGPARFGVYHCAEESLETLRLGEEAVVTGELRVRGISRVNGQTSLVCRIAEPFSISMDCRDKDR